MESSTQTGTRRHYQLTNRLNMETGQWEYAPRYVTVERGRVEVEEEYERCPDCGHTPETGACYRCKMD